MATRTALAAALALLLCTGAAAPSPSDALRGFFAMATRILDDAALDGKPDERFIAIRALAREMFEFREAARLSLGAGWDERTSAEQDEFVRLFGDLLERSFIGSVAARTQIADGVNVRFVGESVDSQTALVQTTMLGKNGHDVPFDYRLVQRDDRWVVRDVAIDGVSLTANYRAQFSRVIHASSYADLVRQMQERAGVTPALPTAVRDERRLPGPVAAAPQVEIPPRAAPSVPNAAPLARTIAPGTIAPSGAPSPRDVKPAVPNVSADVKTSFDPSAATGTNTSAGTSASPDQARSQATRDASSRAPVGASATASTRAYANAGPRAYWVQVAAFKSVEAAKRLASLLIRGLPLPSSSLAIVAGPGPGGADFARVRVGPFADRTQAASRARELEAHGYKPFIALEEK